MLSLMTKSVIRSWRWRDTSRLSVCNWSSSDVGHHVVLRPERGANLWVFFQKLLPHPPASTQLYKLGKGKLHDVVKLMANCRRGPCGPFRQSSPHDGF